MEQVRVLTSDYASAKEARVLPELGLLTKRPDFRWRVSPARSVLELEAEREDPRLESARRFARLWPFHAPEIFGPGGPWDGDTTPTYTCVALMAWQQGMEVARFCSHMLAIEQHGWLEWHGPENRYRTHLSLPYGLSQVSLAERIAYLTEVNSSLSD